MAAASAPALLQDGRPALPTHARRRDALPASRSPGSCPPCAGSCAAGAGPGPGLGGTARPGRASRRPLTVLRGSAPRSCREGARRAPRSSRWVSAACPGALGRALSECLGVWVSVLSSADAVTPEERFQSRTGLFKASRLSKPSDRGYSCAGWKLTLLDLLFIRLFYFAADTPVSMQVLTFRWCFISGIKF